MGDSRAVASFQARHRRHLKDGSSLALTSSTAVRVIGHVKCNRGAHSVLLGQPRREHRDTGLARFAEGHHVQRRAFNLLVADAGAPLRSADEEIGKKPDNHRAAVALSVSFYNLCRVRETQRAYRQAD